jgi:hypothetical protein
VEIHKKLKPFREKTLQYLQSSYSLARKSLDYMSCRSGSELIHGERMLMLLEWFASVAE